MAGTAGEARRKLPEPLIGRIHLVVAMTFLAAAAYQVAAEGASHASMFDAFVYAAVGGFTILIMGTSRMLLTGVFGLRLPWRGAPAFVPAGLAAAAAATWHLPAKWSVVAGLWSVGAVLHGAIVVAALRRRRRATPEALAMARPAVGMPGFVVPGALAYALAAAGLLPLARAGILPLPVLVHVLLTGFVAATIVGVGMVILPRFTRTRLPVPLAAAIGSLVLSGPALLAVGLYRWPAVLRVGAVVESVGLGAFAMAAVALLVRSGRARHTFFIYAAACACVLAALAFGLAFAFDPATRTWVPVHAVLNLFGFAGLFVVGAAIDLYGPSLRPHAAWMTGQAWLTATLALVGLAGMVGDAWGLATRPASWAYVGAAVLVGAGAARGVVADLRRWQDMRPTVPARPGPSGRLR